MATQSLEKLQGLDRQTLVGIYRMMYLSRRLDDKEIQLKRQNKIFFQISGAGHEAVLVAAGMVLRPPFDRVFPYYRARPPCPAPRMAPPEMLLSAVPPPRDPQSAGRPNPSPPGPKTLN